jgi:hypothetical protein
MTRYLVVLEREITETAFTYIEAESPESAAAEAREYTDELYWSQPGIPEEDVPVMVSSVTETT